MERFYDKKNKRLIFTDQEATADFWDKQWGDDFSADVKSVSDNSNVVILTKRFLPPPAKVLEGGCGRGQYVYALDRNGYYAYGVDYAQETVGRIKQNFPELKVSFGDVTGLPFGDGEFDGYWSIGVIEHFYDGYDKIIKEMSRVVKGGGCLFISFPVMSPLRRLKGILGLYKEFTDKDFNKKEFYQFALSWQAVVKDLQALGFELRYKKYTNGFKTIKDETILGALAKIKIAKKFLKILADAMSFFCGHTIILILKKQ
jgi:SAM-dependent methyltransferase